MTLRQLIAFVFAATALLWAGWAWTLWTIDPEATNWIGFVLFYLILFLAFLGTISILGIIIRHKREPDALVYHIVSVSFRQSFLLTVFATALLILQGQRLVHLWVALLGFVAVVALEAFWSMRDLRSRRDVQTNRNRGFQPTVSAVSSPVSTELPPTFTKRII